MCGIGGAISHPDKQNDALVPLILKDQVHRGPDYSSSIDFTDKQLRISLAHNRLAILDLSDRSNQPFIDLQTGACIVFNGEIYNYVELRHELAALGVGFTTKSDTEVLLKAFLQWGTKALNKMIGMFAFAVWDPREGKLTLARDRFGVKPCYYVDQNGQFSFASNTTALAQYFKLDFDLEYLGRGPVYNLFEDSVGSSPFQGIRSLPPGHYLELKNGSSQTVRYYDFASEIENEAQQLLELTDEQILIRLEERLRSAVHLRLRADVPTTISLSGGLDSSLLAYLMSEESNRPKDAFTFGDLSNPRSEAAIAHEAGERMGLKVHFASLPLNQLVDCFEKTLDAQGAPFAHPSVMAQNRVFEEIHRQGYRVSIGGQGADEVFLGYRKFQFFNLREQMRNHQWLGAIGSAYGLARMLTAEIGSPTALNQYFRRYSSPKARVSPFRQGLSQPFNIGYRGYRNLRERQIADVGFSSLATLLRYEDRNSMGHSVESRMPFLDMRVMQLGIALPTRLKIRNGYGKWILRKMAQNRIPAGIVKSRVKLAFSLNTEEWLASGLGNHIQAGVAPKLDALAELFSDTSLATLKDKDTYLNPSHFPLMVTAYWLAKQT
jgi:asparagine synthase (glutamine-hydrolysing)